MPEGSCVGVARNNVVKCLVYNAAVDAEVNHLVLLASPLCQAGLTERKVLPRDTPVLGLHMVRLTSPHSTGHARLCPRRDGEATLPLMSFMTSSSSPFRCAYAPHRTCRIC